MKWETLQSTPEHEVYQLHESGTKVLQLVFSPSAFSLRIDCNNTKRVFFIRREGFLRNRVVIRNEYGIRIGEFGTDNRQQFIIVNDEKFFYASDRSQLVLTREGETHPYVQCDLDLKDQINAGSALKNKYPGNTHPGLLMALCWYKFLPLRKQQETAELAIS